MVDPQADQVLLGHGHVQRLGPDPELTGAGRAVGLWVAQQQLSST